jgi:hypothetical protein
VEKGRKESFLHRIQVHAWGASHLLYETEDYTIQKIQIFSGKSFEYKKESAIDIEWIALKGDPYLAIGDNRWVFSNLNENIIEFVWIEKKIGSAIVPVA